MPKILITGANGLLGRIVWAHLEKQGFDVQGVDVLSEAEASARFKMAEDQNSQILKTRFKGTYFKADVSNKTVMKKVFAEAGKIDIVIHLAAALETETPAVIKRTNEIGSRNVFELCRDNNIKQVIYASSLMVLWDKYSNVYPYSAIKKGDYSAGHLPLVPEIFPVNESNFGETPSIVAYKNSKIRIEKLASLYVKTQGMTMMGLRLGAFNPKNKAIVDPWAFCSHEDLAQFIERAVTYIQSPSAKAFTIFNVCSDNPHCWVSLDRARELLGYKPTSQRGLQNLGRLGITGTFASNEPAPVIEEEENESDFKIKARL